MDGFDLRAGQSGRGERVLPAQRPRVLGEGVEAGGVRGDELVVEHRARRRVLGVEEQFVQHLEQGEVAAGADLEEDVGDLGAASDHPARLLRVLEPDQPGLGQRVHRHDLAAVAFGLFQRRQHARMVRAGVLADDEDQVGFVDIVQRHGALADADGLVQRGTARLVAHVRAVGQVVGAVGAGEQL